MNVRGDFVVKGALRQGSIPTKPRFRSVPDVAVLNSLFRFLRNCLLSTDVFQGASFGILPCLRSVLAVLVCERVNIAISYDSFCKI